MIEGKCPKCGKCYWGWSLLNPRNQSCVKCGTSLNLFEGGREIIKGYSPFTAEECKLKLNNSDSRRIDEEAANKKETPKP